MGEISGKLIEYTVRNSNFEKQRKYLSLSQVYLSEEDLIKQMRNGHDVPTIEKLKCYKGYQMERDLLNRIKAVFGERVQTNVEYSAFDGQAKGHPDFTFDGYPADCKSVLMDSWLPEEKKIPRKVYFQMQAYMLYSGKDRALLIFESRESGLIVDFWIRANKPIQEDIHAKLKQVLTQ